VRDDGADLTHNAVHTYQLKVHANAQVLTFDPQGTLRADRNNKTVVLKPFAFATAITGTVRRRGRPAPPWCPTTQDTFSIKWIQHPAPRRLSHGGRHLVPH